MSLFQYILILLVPLLAANLYAAVAEANWLMQATQLIFVPGLAGIYIKLKKNMGLNAILFFLFFFLAQISGFIFNTNNLSLFAFFFYIIAYFGLSREALKNTQMEPASKTILVYFFLLIAVNTYLLFTHVLELKRYMSSELEFGIYIAYYGVLLVMGIISLIYYLNSYSKKAIYFVTLVLTFIFSDVFRDSAHFYMKDSAILITGNLLWYTGLIFSLLFFLTPERKLRLLNLL
ncbi:hypothetical protein [Salegentibacter salegens]|uniref:YhhN-like protein n=1 Tax=Salegentibacter salegens TaxID=143223 RepID=A0A1M7KI23_9FLAO|nr:hypothetical protein [Salegentibacter salegens]PRX49663.1 hypothetical protein LY58_01072 [Salegentibacter salegens]SHM64722.1 hypothetical protein SAMN05878281_1423 [Salegentibacter salegens]